MGNAAAELRESRPDFKLWNPAGPFKKKLTCLLDAKQNNTLCNDVDFKGIIYFRKQQKKTKSVLYSSFLIMKCLIGLFLIAPSPFLTSVLYKVSCLNDDQNPNFLSSLTHTHITYTKEVQEDWDDF